jgi:light-harvesting protein B-800-850 alpha chain
MNQGRIWCVVHPTVGLPLLLGSVALTSLAVHTAVMTHVTWMGGYWQGAARVRTSDTGSSPALASTALTGQQSAFVLSIAPVAATPGSTNTSFVVTVAPNPAAPIQAATVQPPPAAAVLTHTAMNTP